MLNSITILVNFLFLGAAVWLGIYVVSRNPRNAVGWLTCLTLWSAAGLFLNSLIALAPITFDSNTSTILNHILPSWISKILVTGWEGWLKGWIFVPAAAFWLHATTLLLPGKINQKRWIWVILGYICAILAAELIRDAYLKISTSEVSPLYLVTDKNGYAYFVFIGLFIFFIGICIFNLVDSARKAPTKMMRRQFTLLASATITAALVAPADFISAVIGFSLPRVILSFILGIAVILIGYGVAELSALVEGRTIRRDFFLSAVSIGIVTGSYLFGAWILVQLFELPPGVYLLVLMLSIFSHSLIEISRRRLDMVLFSKDFRILRNSVKNMVSNIEEGGLKDFLKLSLDNLCTSVRAIYGFLVLFNNGQIEILAKFNFDKKLETIIPAELKTDDVLHLEPNTFHSPLSEAALLIPLYEDSNQFGAIILGRPVNGIRFSPENVEKLLYPSDMIAEVIFRTRQEMEFYEKVVSYSIDATPEPGDLQRKITIKDIEDAFRHISDYAYLGDLDLVKIKLVSGKLPDQSVTYVERGKALNIVLVEALDKLKPDDGKPSSPPAREWYPYLVLHGAYIEDKLNRDIMSQLYISEGTFNRTRRSAIRSVTRILQEMEASVN